MLVGLLGLTSCGDDDKPYVKPLNKLTKITCTLNDSNTPLYTADISYTPEGKISSVLLNNSEMRQFVWVQNVLNVIGEADVVRTDYTLSGNTIVKKEVWKKNQYDPTAEYKSNSYTYHYGQRRLSYTDLLMRWPNEDGKTYNEMNYQQDDKYEWTGANMTSFVKDKKVMSFQYEGSMVRPENFPFYVAGEFNPTVFEVYSPLNLMMGILSRDMPTSAYSYVIPETNVKLSEYTFEYTATLSDYLTGMVIHETIHSEKGDIFNTYNYTFEYNYEMK